MSLIEDDNLRELAKAANDALALADRTMIDGRPKAEIDSTWKAFEKARDAYDAYKRELFDRHGGPLDPNAILYREFGAFNRGDT